LTHVIGVAEMMVSSQMGEVIVTYALGSCLGITLYDPVVHVGGMLHVMLPESGIDPAKAAENPCMFVDTGVPRLFHACYDAGARKERLIVKVAGGASIQNSDRKDHFEIGRRNFVMLRKLLWRNGVLLKAHDVGGRLSRTMTLEIGTGQVTVKSNGSFRRL